MTTRTTPAEPRLLARNLFGHPMPGEGWTYYSARAALGSGGLYCPSLVAVRQLFTCLLDTGDVTASRADGVDKGGTYFFRWTHKAFEGHLIVRIGDWDNEHVAELVLNEEATLCAYDPGRVRHVLFQTVGAGFITPSDQGNTPPSDQGAMNRTPTPEGDIAFDSQDVLRWLRPIAIAEAGDAWAYPTPAELCEHLSALALDGVIEQRGPDSFVFPMPAGRDREVSLNSAARFFGMGAHQLTKSARAHGVPLRSEGGAGTGHRIFVNLAELLCLRGVLPQRPGLVGPSRLTRENSPLSRQYS